MADRKFPDDHVARSLYEALNDMEESWEEASEDTRINFLNLALTASAAFQELAEDLGIRLILPGMLPRPRNDAEASAMIAAAKEWLEQPKHARARRKQLVVSPGLILPSHMTRQ